MVRPSTVRSAFERVGRAGHVTTLLQERSVQELTVARGASDKARPPRAPGDPSLAAAARRRASIGDLEDEQSAPVELVAPDVI